MKHAPLTTHATPVRRDAAATLRVIALIALCAISALGGCARNADRSPFGAAGPLDSASDAPECDEPAEGCACAGNQPPLPCRPDDGASQLNQDGQHLCFEGTRHCRDGRFGACEDVRAFSVPARATGTALVDQISDHPQCSDCEPNCHRVVDGFNPDDGPLDGGFVEGLAYHGSGAGVTLEAHDAGAAPEALDGGMPADSLFIAVDEGLTGTAAAQHSEYARAADVYLLLDFSSSMSEENQWLFDRAHSGSGYLPATLTCAGGDAAQLSAGMTGALACMVDDLRVGAGMFRDLPFAPYSEDQSASEPARSLDAKHEIAYRHGFDFTADMSAASASLAGVGALESSGDPDFAGSQIPALYSVATGSGMFTGLDRRSVPAGPSCGSGAGYPCFRDATDRIVVLASDAPMHNGPGNASYDYDPAQLASSFGTVPGVTAISAANDDWNDAYALSADVANELRVYSGNSAGLGAQVEAVDVGCGAKDGAPDATFTFGVNAPGGGANTVPVLVSAEGTGFPAALAVYDRQPALAAETLPAAGSSNERFESAYALGDLHGREIEVSGDTLPMEGDYQASMFGGACGSMSWTGDAIYSFNVDSANGPTPLELTASMGWDNAVVSVYRDDGAPFPVWPATQNPPYVSGNSDATPAHVRTLSLTDAKPYVAVLGDTQGLGADYDTISAGGNRCSPDSDALDAAFKIHVDHRRRLRFDTENSAFDTVISLHNQPPILRSAPVTRWSAASTHHDDNENGATAWPTGAVNGKIQLFEGDTTGMTADVSDRFSCGLDDACGDAVYKISVTAATTLRLQISGTGFEPGVVLTRAAPEGVSGAYGSVAAGGAHSCALSGGKVFCWGADDAGQLGNGGASGAPDSTSAADVGLSAVAQVCAGSSHACAVLRDGRVACWGAGGSGRLGTGDTSDAFSPALLAEFGPSAALGPAVQVACGDAFSCVLLADGRVACFGDNAHGQLGDGTTSEHDAAVLVDSSNGFEQIAAGSRHACAIRAGDDALFCWGEGSRGKLGDGATSDNLVPARAGTLTGVTAVAAGGDHSCAVLSSGRALCWGANDAGQLGIGAADASDHASPLDVRSATGSAAMANVRGIATGRAHSCLFTAEGLAYCFGDNALHQLGSSSGGSAQPRLVGVVDGVVQLTGGAAHACAVARGGALFCWGDNAHGQLGNGNQTTPAAPVPAQAGSSAPLAFGAGKLDAGTTRACRSLAQAPEAGCQLALNAGHGYAFCNDQPRTWAGAAQACNAVGMELVDIDQTGENAYVAGRLDAGDQAWIGVKRESSADWTTLTSTLDFENLAGQRIWRTSATKRCTYPVSGGPCQTYEDSIRGSFTYAAASDLVDSDPSWTTSSTWASKLNPATTAGHDCVTLDSSRKWQTDDCASSASFDGRGAPFAAPPFAGGAEHPYVCEEHGRYTDVALDPGDYYLTVKGVRDGVTGNSCEGPYELQLTDLGAGGGFIACDDDGVANTTLSALEATLDPGDYYVIVKGKHAGDEGGYLLTVRDVDLVKGHELACDAGTGMSDPARLTFMAEPGARYYAMVKGTLISDEGPYTLSIRDSGDGFAPIACDSGSSASGNPAMTLDLRSGTYYAVLKGTAAGAAGDYQLTVGGASPVSSTFTPPAYDETVSALNAAGIRVASVLSCAGRPNCADAQAQAARLASDTGGVALDAATAQDVPLQIVRAVEQLERAETVTGSIVFAPDANPGFMPSSVLALDDPANRCAPGPSGASFTDCLPGATPSFLVSLHNPALAPVPFSPRASGAYEFTLRVESKRGGAVIGTRDVPLIVLPTGAPPPNTYTRGSYHQDIEGKGCLENERPSWDVLRFDGDVRPDTQLDFYVCSAKSEHDLGACNGGPGKSSGRKRVLTVTAGTGAGTPCSVATQSTDCPDGYCSPYTHICNHLEGASCLVDEDCPGTAVGRCRSGPSHASINRTCEVLDLQGDPGSALDGDNLQPFLRVEADLQALGDGSRTPSLFFWEAWYRCRMIE